MVFERIFGKKNKTNKNGKSWLSMPTMPTMPKIRFSTRYIVNKKPSTNNINVFVARKNKETNFNKGIRKIKKIKVRSNFVNPKVKYPEPVIKGGTKKTVKRYKKI